MPHYYVGYKTADFFSYGTRGVHLNQPNIRRDIELVITSQSWKFASIAVAKTQKSLATPDFFGTPTAAKKRISKRISKTIEYLMMNIWWFLSKDSFTYGGISKRSQRGGLENRLGASPRGFESLCLRQKGIIRTPRTIRSSYYSFLTTFSVSE